MSSSPAPPGAYTPPPNYIYQSWLGNVAYPNGNQKIQACGACLQVPQTNTPVAYPVLEDFSRSELYPGSSIVNYTVETKDGMVWPENYYTGTTGPALAQFYLDGQFDYLKNQRQKKWTQSCGGNNWLSGVIPIGMGFAIPVALHLLVEDIPGEDLLTFGGFLFGYYYGKGIVQNISYLTTATDIGAVVLPAGTALVLTEALGWDMGLAQAAAGIAAVGGWFYFKPTLQKALGQHSIFGGLVSSILGGLVKVTGTALCTWGDIFDGKHMTLCGDSGNFGSDVPFITPAEAAAMIMQEHETINPEQAEIIYNNLYKQILNLQSKNKKDIAVPGGNYSTGVYLAGGGCNLPLPQQCMNNEQVVAWYREQGITVDGAKASSPCDSFISELQGMNKQDQFAGVEWYNRDFEGVKSRLQCSAGQELTLEGIGLKSGMSASDAPTTEEVNAFQGTKMQTSDVSQAITDQGLPGFDFINATTSQMAVQKALQVVSNEQTPDANTIWWADPAQEILSTTSPADAAAVANYKLASGYDFGLWSAESVEAAVANCKKEDNPGGFCEAGYTAPKKAPPKVMSPETAIFEMNKLPWGPERGKYAADYLKGPGGKLFASDPKLEILVVASEQEQDPIPAKCGAAVGVAATTSSAWPGILSELLQGTTKEGEAYAAACTSDKEMDVQTLAYQFEDPYNEVYIDALQDNVYGAERDAAVMQLKNPKASEWAQGLWVGAMERQQIDTGLKATPCDQVVEAIQESGISGAELSGAYQYIFGTGPNWKAENRTYPNVVKFTNTCSTKYADLLGEYGTPSYQTVTT